MNTRDETIKFQKHISGKLLDTGLKEDFWIQHQSRGNKTQVGEYHIKKLPHSKGNHQQNGDNLLNGRKYLQNIPDKGLIPKIYKELIHLNSKNKFDLKMG